MLSAHLGADVLNNNHCAFLPGELVLPRLQQMFSSLSTQQDSVVISRGPDPELWAISYFCSANTSHSAQ